jgi:large repetitive protein
MKLKFLLFFVFLFGCNTIFACNISVSATSAAICIGKQDTLTVSGGTNYIWMPGNTAGATIYVSPPITTTYTVYATGANNCLDTAIITVTVNPLPTIVAAAINNTVCQGLSPVLSATGGVSYIWQPGNFSGQIFSATPNINTNYTVFGTNSNGCKSNSSIFINVTPAPKPKLLDSFAIATGGTPFNNCSNSSTSSIYTVSVSSPNVSTVISYDLNWGNGTPVLMGLTNNSFPLYTTYATFGVYYITYTAHYANGCVRDSIIKVVNQKNPAIGLSTAGSTSGCAPVGYWFKISNYQSNANGTYYEWDFGDGSPLVTWNTVLVDSIFHSFTTSSCGQLNDEFIVSVKAINACKETKATVSGVAIYTKPSTNFNIYSTPACIGNAVSFTNNSTPAQNSNCSVISTWKWNFGDGTISNNTTYSTSLNNEMHTYNTTGNYTVTLIGGTPGGGCGSDTIQKPICVENNIVNYSMALPANCAPAIAQMNNTSPNTDCVLAPFTWVITKQSFTCAADSALDFEFINNTNTTSILPSIRFNNQGVYRIRLQHTNSCGIVVKDTLITIKRKPLFTITSLSQICEGDNLGPNVSITNCANNTLGYTWTSTVGSISNATILLPIFIFPAGTHTFGLSANNECGTTTTSKTIIVNPKPIIGLTANPNPICAGKTTTITASGANTYTYTPYSVGAVKTVTLNANTSYTVIGTNASGCTNSSTIAIIVNPNPSVLATATSPTCLPGNDAVITVAASAGTPAYIYKINNGSGQPSGVFSAIGIGNYTLSVTDINGCTTSTTKSISTPNAPIIYNALKVNVTCNGLNNGSISVNAGGGSGGLQFNLQPGNITNSVGAFTSLSPNNYTITVTDNSGCSTQTVVVITQPIILGWASVTPTNVTCNGLSNGSISSNVSGGTSPYTYTLMPASATNNFGYFGNKPYGNYTISVSDNKGCSLSTTIVITEPPALTWGAITAINLTCNNINTGSITANASGGTGSITYKRLPNNTTNTTGIFNALAAATYTIIATDANNCIINTTVSITQPLAVSITNIASTLPSCTPGSDGTITIAATGGTPGLMYKINNGTSQVANNFTGLNTGVYNITVTDANGCTANTTKSIIAPNAPNIISTSPTNVRCNGLNNGSVQVIANGGTGTLQYKLMPGNVINATGNYLGLAPNTYTITVTDNVGCSVFTILNITQPAALNISNISITPASCFGNSDGSIAATSIGGSPSINFSLQPSNATNLSGSFTAKPAGNYTIIVTDANGCTASSSAAITQAPSLVWGNISSTNIACNNYTTGAINVSSVGGNGTTSFLVLPNNTTNTTGVFNTLAAATYTIIATDANNCSINTTVSITQPTAISITNIASTLPSCTPGSDGTITIAATGGTPGLMYKINNGTSQLANNFTGLNTGVYNITVTDANGCTATTTKSIIAPNAPNIISASQINVTCNGLNNGSVQVSANGGTGALQYKLMPGNVINATGNYSGLTANIYTISAIDAVGCIVQTTLALLQPSAVVISSILPQSATCFGYNNGVLTTTASGGTGSLIYTVAPANINNNSGVFYNLSAGTYTIFATDANNCSASNSVSLLQAPLLIIDSLVNGLPSCIATSIAVFAQGGTLPYTYTINNSMAVGTPLFTNISAGTYTLSVADANGCTTSQTKIIVLPNPPVINNVVVKNVSCNGLSNGAISGIGATSGNLPYSFSLLPNNSFINLNANSYTIVCTDGNNCTGTSIVTISQPAILSTSSIIKKNVLCFNDANGFINLQSIGGSGTLDYTLLPANITNNTGIFSGLNVGNYTISIIDDSSCVYTVPFAVANQLPLLFANVLTTPITCNGLSNASIASAAAGGVGAYTYSINPAVSVANTSGSFQGLYPSSFTVTVKDSNLCSKDSVIVFLPKAPVSGSAIIQQNVLCAGAANGSFIVLPNSGIAPFTYYLLNSTQTNTSGIFSNLTVGNYSVQIVDSLLCSSIISPIVITQPMAINWVNIRTAKVLCEGYKTDSVLALASGGVGNITYSINPLGPQTNTTGNFAQLSAQTYTITARDANNCTITTSLIVSQNAPIVYSSFNVFNASCSGDTNGFIKIQTLGGVSPIRFSINNNAFVNNGNFTSLGAGIYSIQVADFNNCTKDTIITLLESGKLLIDKLQVGSVICNKANDAQITIAGSGNVNSYTYSLLPDSVSNNTGVFANLASGNYTVYIKDSFGCSLDTAVYVTPAFSPLQIGISKQDLGCIGAGTEAWAQADVFGGAQPYTYVWNTSPVQFSKRAIELTDGYYTVVATDFKGCTITDTIYINAGNCCSQIYIPNAFTPNGDNVNDYFGVKTSTGLKLLHFEVLNRYGQQVWKANVNTDKWNGMMNNSKCDIGSYFYIYQYECNYDGKVYILKGDVNLFR